MSNDRKAFWADFMTWLRSASDTELDELETHLRETRDRLPASFSHLSVAVDQEVRRRVDRKGASAPRSAEPGAGSR